MLQHSAADAAQAWQAGTGNVGPARAPQVRTAPDGELEQPLPGCGVRLAMAEAQRSHECRIGGGDVWRRRHALQQHARNARPERVSGWQEAKRSSRRQRLREQRLRLPWTAGACKGHPTTYCQRRLCQRRLLRRMLCQRWLALGGCRMLLLGRLQLWGWHEPRRWLVLVRDCSPLLHRRHCAGGLPAAAAASSCAQCLGVDAQLVSLQKSVLLQPQCTSGLLTSREFEQPLAGRRWIQQAGPCHQPCAAQTHAPAATAGQAGRERVKEESAAHFTAWEGQQPRRRHGRLRR